MKIGIHQPNFMPWIGYFNKINQSDKFVFLDNVKCSKNSFFNRNRFSTSKKFSDFFWLTCSLKKESYRQNLCDVMFDQKLLKKHVKHFKIRHGKTKEQNFLEGLISLYEKQISSVTNANLCNFNKAIINFICENLEIQTDIILASEIKNITGLKKENLVIGIIKELDGQTYISGHGAKNYQDENKFISQGINLQYLDQNFINTPVVNCEHVSIVDIILQEGLWKTKKMILH